MRCRALRAAGSRGPRDDLISGRRGAARPLGLSKDHRPGAQHHEQADDEDGDDDPEQDFEHQSLPVVQTGICKRGARSGAAEAAVTRAALLTLHGMGRTPPDYAAGLIAAVRSRLGPDAAAVSFEAVWYQRELQRNQEELWRRASREHRLGWPALRRFVLFNLSDAVGLEAGKDEAQSSYYFAQLRVAQALLQARDEMGGDGPVVVLTNSLGAQVFSSFVYDAQRALAAERGQRTPPSAGIWVSRATLEQALGGGSLDDGQVGYLRGATLDALLTTGCNIPVFVASHRRMSVRAIERPNPHFEWHNYFDPADVLGWPLQPLEGGYRELARDHVVQVGNALIGWTPLAHDAYWRDRAVLDAVVAQLQRALAPRDATSAAPDDG